jgi:hypothetical protein
MCASWNSLVHLLVEILVEDVDHRALSQQGVEHTSRAMAVFAQGGKERRPVARRDTLEHAEVLIECALPRVEHPPELVAEPGGDVLHLDLR